MEAVANPEMVPAASFNSSEAWPLMTGAQDIVQIASAFVADGFNVRSVTLVDRQFRPANEDDYADVLEAVRRNITSGSVPAALAASREVDLFVEQVRLFEKSSASSIDIRQNGVIFASHIEIGRIGQILSRAFNVQ